MAFSVLPVGRQIGIHGYVFAYVCSACAGRVRVSPRFQQAPMSYLEASQAHAYCYVCYAGLDGGAANYQAYHVMRAGDGHLLPSAFALLEIGLVCDEVEEQHFSPTLGRVYGQLLENGMIWTRSSLQAALSVLYPATFAPVFLVDNADP